MILRGNRANYKKKKIKAKIKSLRFFCQLIHKKKKKNGPWSLSKLKVGSIPTGRKR
jgi:hypothetical protein